MDHGISQLTSIAIVAAVAVVLGFAFMRLRQPPIVGYILAGLILGPTGLKFVEHTETISLLAELGVLMLLFIIGMELSIRAFVMVLRPAATIVLGQIVASLLVTAAFGFLMEWRLDQMLVLAFIVTMSSTAVAFKILEEIDELRTETGRITVGIMIAQDLAIVPILIFTSALGRGGEAGDIINAALVAKMVISIGGLVVFLWYLGKPGKFKLPFTDLIQNREDVMALAMLAFCFSAATLSGLAGISAAYGAFVAGLIVSRSTLRAEAIKVTEPIQSILVFIFFLSIGLLLDLEYVRDNWVVVGLFATGVILMKTVLNVILVRYVGFAWNVALPAGLSTAQIGEFSFILAAIGLSNRVLDPPTYKLALSVIAVTLIVSPLWMNAVRRFHEAALSGIVDLRTAMSESFSEELTGFNRFVRTLRVVRRRGAAAAGSRGRAVRKKVERIAGTSLKAAGKDEARDGETTPPDPEEAKKETPPVAEKTENQDQNDSAKPA